MKDLTNLRQLKLSEEINLFNDAVQKVNNFQNHNDSDLKINCYAIFHNLELECYREQLVSFLGMHEVFKHDCPLDEADYILYMHPYARIEDAAWKVIEELEFFDANRKEGAEIIVLGKSANVKDLLNGRIKNISFIDSHFAEAIGKRFNLNCRERYFVYDDIADMLSIWPVDGCLSKCAFCRRCYMNIKFESLPLDVIEENMNFIQKIAPEKMKHISLRGENLTEYGLDLYSEQRLQDVIRLIASYSEVEKIEIPIGLKIGEINDEILDVLCECKKITDLSLNIEAGTNRLLSVINKGQTIEETKKVLGEINKRNPNVSIASTIMLGLPTEEVIDVYELAKLIAEYKVDNVLCNFYGNTERLPLAKLPQLTSSLREYHLKVFLKTLKDNLTHDIHISYPYIFRRKNERYNRLMRKLEEEESRTGLGSTYRDLDGKYWKKVK